MLHGSAARPRLVCLLPARNAAHDLPGYFASVERFADAIVALDDGSTDATAELLAAHPLVAILLRNPQRPDYRGWNDAANRNRLLEAAAQLAPEWIISLDADERIDPADAAALREFLSTDALPGCAYGFQCFPMHRDLTHYSPTFIWVYRLFAFAPGQRFPDRRLHFSPIPTSIPRQAFIRTTLRIQHLANLTPERRRARFEKYRQADPDCHYWPDYSSLLQAPDESLLQIWQPRAPGTPVLLPTSFADDLTPPAPETGHGQPVPALSVVVLATTEQDPTSTLTSVTTQSCSEQVEIIAVMRSNAPGLANIRQRWPNVRIVEIPDGASESAARNAGLHAASGRYIMYLTPDMMMQPGTLAALLAAHHRGYALVTGEVREEPTSITAVAEAVLHPRGTAARSRSGILTSAPAWCSYARDVLLEMGGFPDLKAAVEPVTIHLLRHRGYLAYRDEAARLTIRSSATGPARFIASAFWRGAARAHLLLSTASAEPARPADFGRRLLRYSLHRLPPISRRLRRHSAPAIVRLAATPLVALGEITTWLGMALSLASSKQARLQMLGWQPAHLLLIIGRAGGEVRQVALVRLDAGRGGLRGVVLPLTLRVEGTDGATIALANATAPVRTRTDALAVITGAVGISIHDFAVVKLEEIGWELVAGGSPENELRRALAGLTASLTPARLLFGSHRRIFSATSLRFGQLVALRAALRAAFRHDPTLAGISALTGIATAPGGSGREAIADQVRASLGIPAAPVPAATRSEQLRHLPLV